MRRGELVYWFVGSLLLGWILNPLAHGQVVWQSVTPTQCYGCCPPQSCQPRSLPYVSPQRPQPDGEYTQPAPQFQPLPSPPQPTTPALPPPPKTPEVVKIDWTEYDQRQQKLLDAIAANKCECKPCECKPVDLTPLVEKLDVLIAAANKPTPPPPQTPPPQHEQHVVIVADHNAPYWQRLADAITNARKTYSGIQDTALPNFPIGIHPQAVVYRNSVPVRVVKGQYEVENLLSRASRGESL